VALMEIVSRPDTQPCRSGRLSVEAADDPALCRLVRRQHGSGFDARGRQRLGASSREPFGTRTETKNVNSVRFVMQAIEYEANRQVDVLEGGGKIVQETRLFDPDSGTTRSMRSKEDARLSLFPRSDLLPLELTDAFIEDCRASLPELPDAKRHRYETVLGLSSYNAGVLTAEVETARWFEKLLAESARRQASPKATSRVRPPTG
jgi:aspartyl-tRNA(Asn)/glutamyl-tRNA(Gln) amidotransferase subunit B